MKELNNRIKNFLKSDLILIPIYAKQWLARKTNNESCVCELTPIYQRIV